MNAVEFWARVLKEPDHGCWLWTGAADPNGYGRVRWNGATRLTHRVAWLLTHGEQPMANGRTAHLRHTCDNPPCCNPDHLLPGTQADNMRDAAERGRSATGENGAWVGPKTKISRDDAMKIRAQVSVFDSRDLATFYGLSRHTIYSIKNRHTWGWLEDSK